MFPKVQTKPGASVSMDETKMWIHNLLPDPAQEWKHLLQFALFTQADKQAMSETVEVLFRRGPELVVGVYDYLRSVPETAAVLGWETEIDEEHLEERRRFFTIWLARTLGMDTGEEFGDYLFYAGKAHAGHGPRQIHVPPAYVRASIGLLLANFARFMHEAGLPGEKVAPAMAGWSKYLSVQLHMMELGYEAARRMDEGKFPVTVRVYGVLRPKLPSALRPAWVHPGDTVETVLRKFFSYYPEARREVLDVVWEAEEKPDSLWMDVVPVYVPKMGWRILLNGREVAYLEQGVQTPVKEGDTVDIFPPGR